MSVPHVGSRTVYRYRSLGVPISVQKVVSLFELQRFATDAIEDDGVRQGGGPHVHMVVSENPRLARESGMMPCH